MYMCIRVIGSLSNMWAVMYMCIEIIQLCFHDFPIGFSSLNVCDLDFASTIPVLLPGMNSPQTMLDTSVTN